MWTPLQSGLGGANSHRVEMTPPDHPTARLEDLLASLNWFDRILLRVGIRWVRRIFVTIIGLTVVGIGLIMIVAPGPATLVIPLGLAILGLEYAWARRLLRRLRSYVEKGVVEGSALLGLSKSPRRGNETTADQATPHDKSPSSECHSPSNSG